MTSPNQVWHDTKLRTASAIGAAASADLMCIYQQHFLLSLSDPASFARAVTHRCGDALLATSIWMTIEVLHLCWRARQRHQFAARWAAYEAARDAELA